MKKINQLLDCDYNINISGITCDSRLVKDNYLFIATKGYNVDHFDYINDAIKNGAVCIIADRKIDIKSDVFLIVVDDIISTYEKICYRFYDIDISLFNFIGITGTDGKTTTSSIIKQIINNSSKIAYIGTNGMEVSNVKYSVNNTTPCLEELCYLLSIIKKYNCKDIVMEVSSEALLYGRVDSILYSYVGFTNITEDHLNIHKNIDNYINSKKHILDLLSDNGYLIVNGDDEICRNLTYSNIFKYGFNSDNDYVISSVKYENSCVKFDINYNNDVFHINGNISGKYNVYNITLAFIISYLYGIDSNDIISSLKNLNVINGRREFLNYGQDYNIVLDYAHTYNGIKELISSFSNYKNIIVVTGAAGGREKCKRGLIGKYLLNNTSFVIFTMDDPRYEKPLDIINDLIGECTFTNYKIIIDRYFAIKYALDMAKKNDLVLIIGKGRDNYMAILDKKIKYCDYDVINRYFNC